jgi:hypothetical protein
MSACVAEFNSCRTTSDLLLGNYLASKAFSSNFEHGLPMIQNHG